MPKSKVKLVCKNCQTPIIKTTKRMRPNQPYLVGLWTHDKIADYLSGDKKKAKKLANKGRFFGCCYYNNSITQDCATPEGEL